MAIKGIIDGFDEDFNSLVSQFPESYPNVRLTEFLNYWNENHFDYLFANRFDPRELLESLDQINQFLVNVLLEHPDTNSWLLSLYFILCIRVKQHSRVKCRIRLRLEDAILIEKLISSLETSNKSDAQFAWTYLKRNDAIDFVEERNIFGPHILRKGGVKDYCDIAKLAEFNDESVKFAESYLDPLLQGIESIIEPYEELKRSLKLSKDYENLDGKSMKDLLKEAKDFVEKFKSV